MLFKLDTSHVSMLAHSDAQLTSPGEAVCVGEQVVFVCQQTGPTLTWRVDLPGGSSIERSVLSPEVGTVVTFVNDPGLGFEIHILSPSSAGIISELRVTAVRQLNGVTVECRGASGSFMSTIAILIMSGEFTYPTIIIVIFIINTAYSINYYLF